jgi:hypothetical protein
MDEVVALVMSFPSSVLLLSVAYFVFEMSPLVFSAIVVVRRRATMKRKLLFVGTVTVVTYGAFLMLFAVAFLPVGAFVIFLVPALKELGYFDESYALAVASFVANWWWLILPPTIAVVAISVTEYLDRRWNGIVNAL